jgi:hypothetical protein
VVRRIALFGCFALVIAAAVAVCWWLRFPGSLFVLARTLGDARRPVTFDYTFVGPPAPVNAEVNATYIATTPIFGISQHWVNIIAPMTVDTINKKLDATVAPGRLTFQVPLGIPGLSGFRLRYVSVLYGRTSPDVATDLSASPTDSGDAPTRMTIPEARSTDGTFDYDGPLALWAMTGSTNDATGFVYAPRVVMTTREVLWDGLRSVRARVDLTHYPMPAFQPPVGWTATGWGLSGVTYTHAPTHATLTDQGLVIARDARVPMPFSRDCTTMPEFAAVAPHDVPAWSPWPQPNGLWRAVPVADWRALVARARNAPLTTKFVPSARPPADGIEAVDLDGRTVGKYRLFAACPSPHYGSVAVVWIDVEVRPDR